MDQNPLPTHLTEHADKDEAVQRKLTLYLHNSGLLNISHLDLRLVLSGHDYGFA